MIPLTSDDLYREKITSQNLKKKFSTYFEETLHFGSIFVTKNFNFGVSLSHSISGHVISQNMEFIRLAISQPFLKIETFGLEQKIL